LWLAHRVAGCGHHGNRYGDKDDSCYSAHFVIGREGITQPFALVYVDPLV
jgi:hypothetical protein